MDKTIKSGSDLNDIQGVVVPLITPLYEDGRVNKKDLMNLIQFLMDAGIENIFILGSSGEGVSLPYAEKVKVVETACGFIDGRANVLVGIGGTCVQEAVDLLKVAERFNPQAIVSPLPCYYHLQELEIANYYRSLADNTDIPLMAYNIPSFVQTNITAETAIMLFERGIITGIKDSANRWESIQKLLMYAALHPDFKVYIGDEGLYLAGGLIGTAGFVSAGANIMPEVVLALYQACQAGRKKQALDAYAHLLRIRAIYNRKPSFIANIKGIAEIKELCHRWLSSPLHSLSDDEFGQLKNEYLQSEINDPRTTYMAILE